MSAIDYIPYPRGKGYYETSAKKAGTIARLIVSNERFKQDVDEIRKRFKLDPPYTIVDPDFKPRPYDPKIETYTGRRDSIYDNPGFTSAVKKIANRLNFDGNMVNFVKDYVLFGDDELFFMPHFRKDVKATAEIDEKGIPYINLKLYGPVVAKDVEAAWGQFEAKIKEWYPLSSQKAPIHNDNAGLTWLIYELNLAGLSDSEVAETMKENEVGDYTGNEINRILTRLHKQIDKSYR